MLIEFERQLTSYKEGLVRPLEMAQKSNPTDAMRAVGTMKWNARLDNLWNTSDGAALIRHVQPSHRFVTDEISRTRSAFGKSLGQASGREDSEVISRLLYEGIQRFRYGYELEPPVDESGMQRIRNPTQIATHRSATCIDLSCLFAALLEAANQRSFVVVLEGTGFAHALVGYRAPNEPAWDAPTIGTLRRAVNQGDAVLFESTGAVEADAPVGSELPNERADRLLIYADAKAAATRMLMDNGIRLKYFLDVRDRRNNQTG
jgi:hypothetical protein